ncbi:MAG: hypothetical protein JSW33_01565 [bacterium]|nr:MAG: hypothetical protein JSW33_01565 [bacterium]
MNRFLLAVFLSSVFFSVSCNKSSDILSFSPQVFITNPSEGDTISDTILIQVSITHQSEIIKVDFYLDDNLFGTDETEPFEMKWNTADATNGDHTLYCRATDQRGIETVSESIGVTIKNTSPLSIEQIDLMNGDGYRLAGTLFYNEDAEIGIVMAHSGVPGQSQLGLHPLASQLADSGFTVLTFDLRGYGLTGGFPSYGRVHIDVWAAINYLRDLGYIRIGTFGVGLGAIGIAMTGQHENVVGLVLISCPISVSPPTLLITEEYMAPLTYPKLVIAAENDFANGRPFAQYATTIYNYCQEPRQLVLFSGSFHSMELFESEHEIELNQMLISFFEDLR